jgi:hypothetical protein
MKWIRENFKTIIYISFIVPILAVAFVSISHVTTWYGLTNPISWAIYLSVGIEIAALSALAAISAKMGSKVYFPFGIVTLIQFIGNIFFAYQYIDTDGQAFKDWVDLVEPMVAYLGIESGDIIGHKRFLALFSGGMLPIISLSFLHMLVKFEEENKEETPRPNNLITETKSDNIVEPLIEDDKVETNNTNNLVEEYKTINETKFNFLKDLPIEEGVQPKSEDKPSDSQDGVRRLSYVRRDA